MPADTPLTDALERDARGRAKARTEAESALQRRGFVRSADGRWRGEVRTLPGDAAVDVAVELPPEFPHRLPIITLPQRAGTAVVPHLEENGKVCIAPDSNLLLDTERPVQIIEDALTRARRTLDPGLHGPAPLAFAPEFDAYWRQGATKVLSLCDSEAPSRPIHVARVSMTNFKGVLVADSTDQARAWLQNVGTTSTDYGSGFLLRLRDPPQPVPADSRQRTGPWLDKTLAAADSDDRRALRAWQESFRLPAVLLFSFPVPGSALRGLCSVELPASGRVRKAALKGGFRPHTVTGLRELAASRREPLEKRAIVRVDGSYLLRRGSASLLASKRVLVAGCGALGATLAYKLAAVGVGRLDLVDPEPLMPENCHRHELGIDSVFMHKARALAERLRRRFPHQTVAAHQKGFEELLTSDAGTVASADLLVLVTGDETLERRLSRLLAPHLSRVHAWVEPLGVGGHVLVAPRDLPGCFECLFARDDSGLLVNTAAFSAPGQEFLRRIGGCAAAYSPFSYLDSDRVASLAASSIVTLLTNDTSTTTLVSWRGDEREFLRAGFSLSHRGVATQRETVSRVPLSRPDCPACQRGAKGP